MTTLEFKLQELPCSVEEALNRLRVNVKFCGENTRKILITSSVPDEGKSFVGKHLWRLLAESGFKTVLVDVDLRKSVLKKNFKYQQDGELTGIGHYLSGQAEMNDCIYSTNIENAYVMPCTRNLQNPTSLFEDPKFAELLDKLAEEYRYVIIDSPPLVNVSDGAQIASCCDGAILVVRAGYVQKKFIRQSLQQLRMVNCQVLGSVINFIETGTGKYGKYYGKYYGNYYGNYSDRYYGNEYYLPDDDTDR